ncbi:hemerythrin domain-containing protein [Infirmifilum sp. SLHALR2]|nr:MAG: hypothetical protein B7L53_06315 [Thermofilum sp. NZ13]
MSSTQGVSERREAVREEWLRQHGRVEENVISYADYVLSEYEKEPEKYSKHINNFIERVEELLYPHDQWEEEKAFALFRGHPLVNALTLQHREIEQLLSGAKSEVNPVRKVQMLKTFLEVLRIHVKAENEQLIPMLR